MNDINPYYLLNERERLIHEIRLSYKSTAILSYNEKKRREEITAQSISRLVSNGKSIIGQNLNGSGRIRSKNSKAMVIEQKNAVETYNYAEEKAKKDCIIEIQFPAETNFGSYMLGDRIYFTGKILKINVETSGLHLYSFAPSGNSFDIMVENISFQKQEKSDGPCFIATAVYKDYNAPVVRELREFRNTHLLDNHAGRFLVSLYYRYSPRLANLIKRFAVLRRITKILIVLPAYLLARLARIWK